MNENMSAPIAQMTKAGRREHEIRVLETQVVTLMDEIRVLKGEVMMLQTKDRLRAQTLDKLWMDRVEQHHLSTLRNEMFKEVESLGAALGYRWFMPVLVPVKRMWSKPRRGFWATIFGYEKMR